MTVRRLVAGLLVLTASAVVLTSCANTAGSPTAPSAAGPWTGVWQGTLTDADGATGVVRMTLDERRLDAGRSLVSGSWSAAFADSTRNGTGAVGGTISDGIGALILTPAAPIPCQQIPVASAGSYSVSPLALSAGSLRGTYSQVLCSSTRSGTLTMTKP